MHKLFNRLWLCRKCTQLLKIAISCANVNLDVQIVLYFQMCELGSGIICRKMCIILTGVPSECKVEEMCYKVPAVCEFVAYVHLSLSL